MLRNWNRSLTRVSSVDRGLLEDRCRVGVGFGLVEDRLEHPVQGLFAGAGRYLVQHRGQGVEEDCGVHPLGLVFPGGGIARGEGGGGGPVGGAHRAGELGQRVGHDLVDERLDRGAVCVGVVHEHAGDAHGDAGVVAEHLSDAFGDLAGPGGGGEQVAAGFGAVHRAELREGVGALVDGLVDPEPAVEVGDLDHRGTAAGVQDAETVDHVLVGAGDDPLFGADVVVQHADRSGRARGDDPAEQARGGHLLHDRQAVVHVHQRPAPQIGQAAHAPQVVLGHPRTRDRHGRGARGDGRGSSHPLTIGSPVSWH